MVSLSQPFNLIQEPIKIGPETWRSNGNQQGRCHGNYEQLLFHNAKWNPT